VAWCPHPPLIVPQIAGNSAPDTESLRLACMVAIGQLLAAATDRVMIIGSHGRDRGLRGYAPGVADLPETELPLALAIGDWLLDRVGCTIERVFLPVGAPAPVQMRGDRSTALLVMGDGSARRSLKGPGYLDPRAKPFDDAVVAALADGETKPLAELDPELAAQLLVAGAPAWRAAADLIGTDTAWRGEIHYADAPFGVMYVVASWLPA
jgi:hypothetical protein